MPRCPFDRPALPQKVTQSDEGIKQEKVKRHRQGIAVFSESQGQCAKTSAPQTGEEQEQRDSSAVAVQSQLSQYALKAGETKADQSHRVGAVHRIAKKQV